MINPAARRYAEAFFYLSEDLGRTSDYYNELKIISDAVEGNAELRGFLRSPFIGIREKKNVINGVFGDSQYRDVTNFIKLLVDKQRIGQISNITEAIKNLINDKEKVIEGEVVSAIELSEDELKRLEESLSKRYYRTIKLENKIDKSVLGGLLVRVGNEQIDGTLKRRLAKIGEKLSISIP